MLSGYDADDVFNCEYFFLEIDGLQVPFFITRRKIVGDKLVVKFEDIDTEEKAKELLKKKISVEEHLLPTGADEEGSFKDLIGYTLIDESFGTLGPLNSVQEMPHQLIAQCFVNGKEVLFPLTDNFIESIDDAEKIIRLQLPQGLLDVYLSE